MAEINLISAFVVGLLGGVHCVGMCGGIIGALSLSLPEAVRQQRLQHVLFISLYNIGRILSYSLAGFIVGVVDRAAILDGSAVRNGDVLVGLPSTGLHTNGYSLLRKVFEWAQQNVTSVLCSCLATHAAMQFQHGQKRTALPAKRWGDAARASPAYSHPAIRRLNNT